MMTTEINITSSSMYCVNSETDMIKCGLSKNNCFVCTLFLNLIYKDLKTSLNTLFLERD